MTRQGLGFGDSIDMFNAAEDHDLLNADPQYRLLGLASEYWSFERKHGSNLPLFTAAELGEIVAGNGPTSAPWPARRDTTTP